MSQAIQDYKPTVVEVPEKKRQKLLEKAKSWADKLGSLRGSIENGDGNIAGRYGELLFQEIFGGAIADHYDYDIAYNGLSIDVKTKRRTVKAKGHYEASIPDFNPDQSADLYYFMSVRCGDVKEPYQYTDLMGYITPQQYHNTATFHKQGEKDPANGFTFSADCWNLRYDKLEQYETLADKIKL